MTVAQKCSAAMEIQKFHQQTYGRTNGLTWVGARDTCMSKNGNHPKRKASNLCLWDEIRKSKGLLMAYNRSRNSPENVNVFKTKVKIWDSEILTQEIVPWSSGQECTNHLGPFTSTECLVHEICISSFVKA